MKDYLIRGMTTMTNLISDALKEELKALIHEVLDERDFQKRLNGPYDLSEDELDQLC